MLTIFTTAKPFQGRDRLIQENAVGSWIRQFPDCEVILFGNEPGAAETARKLGIRHVPEMLLSEFGTKRLDYIFGRAQEIARHNILCYANCDIIFIKDFPEAITRVARWSPQFLMIGQRWDTPLDRAIHFEAAGWGTELRDLAKNAGTQQLPYAVDYFVFSRGLYRQMPPFVIARTHWDHWLVWKARSMKVPVVDASADVLAIHQNHDYAYHPGGLAGIKADIESERNRALAGGQLHLYTIEHATHELIRGRIRQKPGSWHVPASSLIRVYLSQLWYWMLKVTFNQRRVLGLTRTRLTGRLHRLRCIVGAEGRAKPQRLTKDRAIGPSQGAV